MASAAEIDRDSEFDRLVVENARLKAAMKAMDYEREKLLELVNNLISNPPLQAASTGSDYVMSDHPSRPVATAASMGKRPTTTTSSVDTRKKRSPPPLQSSSARTKSQSMNNKSCSSKRKQEKEQGDEEAGFEPVTFDFSDLKEAAEELARLAEEEEYYDEDDDEDFYGEEEEEWFDPDAAAAVEGRPRHRHRPQGQGQGQVEEEDVEIYDPQADDEAIWRQREEVFGAGETSRKVMAAETGLQSDFIQFCDANSPNLWPCMPLNPKYG